MLCPGAIVVLTIPKAHIISVGRDGTAVRSSPRHPSPPPRPPPSPRRLPRLPLPRPRRPDLPLNRNSLCQIHPAGNHRHRRRHRSSLHHHPLPNRLLCLRTCFLRIHSHRIRPQNNPVVTITVVVRVAIVVGRIVVIVEFRVAAIIGTIFARIEVAIVLLSVVTFVVRVYLRSLAAFAAKRRLGIATRCNSDPAVVSDIERQVALLRDLVTETVAECRVILRRPSCPRRIRS
jgi:hypothetical protein